MITDDRRALLVGVPVPTGAYGFPPAGGTPTPDRAPSPVTGGSRVGQSSLRESFAACHEITRKANSSFPAAFRLLAPARRRAMDALYAYMRVTDDLADEAPAQAAVPGHSGRGAGASSARSSVTRM